MARKVVVLGCGLVGATMARDLAADRKLSVTVADVNPANLQAVAGVRGLATAIADLSRPDKVRALIRNADAVVGALPSRFGFATLRTVIESGKPYCDISFMPEDAMDLDSLARRRGVTAVVDCGVAPGLANLAIGYATTVMDEVEEAHYLVGGLPHRRTWPFEYKAPFAPADVIEEYTRPARLKLHGRVVTRPALSDPELFDFPQVGTLEGALTDGLRSLLKTVKVPNMFEKTLRYPGHAALMRIFREVGFFSKNPIEIGAARVRPLDVTSALLFPLWKRLPDESEFTILRVVARGRKGKRREIHTFDLFDETDSESGASSMARTTGFPCTITTRLLVSGDLHLPGVHPPEVLAREKGYFAHMTRELSRRGVEFTHSIEHRPLDS